MSAGVTAGGGDCQFLEQAVTARDRLGERTPLDRDRG
ncbi:MAG: hypothetical protein J07HX64_01456 [halophilic archaeon J07HX64]|nr:MAG: hypothetical protein J07HX64_01456 [halophilic archaeon J07HX64]